MLEGMEANIRKMNFCTSRIMIVREPDGKQILVTGCSHNGIVNIIEHL